MSGTQGEKPKEWDWKTTLALITSFVPPAVGALIDWTKNMNISIPDEQKYIFLLVGFIVGAAIAITLVAVDYYKRMIDAYQNRTNSLKQDAFIKAYQERTDILRKNDIQEFVSSHVTNVKEAVDLFKILGDKIVKIGTNDQEKEALNKVENTMGDVIKLYTPQASKPTAAKPQKQQ
jgi:hypothetical protein